MDWFFFHILSIENTITINSDKLNIYLYLNLLIVFFPLKTYLCSKMETLNSWHTKTMFIWDIFLLNHLQVIIGSSNHSWIHRSTYTLVSIDRVRSTYRLLCNIGRSFSDQAGIRRSYHVPEMSVHRSVGSRSVAWHVVTESTYGAGVTDILTRPR